MPSLRLIRFVVSMFSVGVMAIASGALSGQTYPNKPLRIVTTLAGSGSNFIARLIAQGITGPLGQPVIVENRPTGAVMVEIVARAPPDGYTLLLAGNTIWIGPLLQNMPYDPIKDFSPISMAEKSASILAVHPSLPVNSVKELIAFAKAKPGELNYGSGPTGTPSHLAGELFKAMAGVNIVVIPYKSGAAAATNALLGGEIQMILPSVGVVAPHIKSGRVRALAVTSAEPSTLFPGLPTVAASGLPGYEAVSMTAILAPAKTPAVIINRLNLEIVRFLNTAEAREPILASGSDIVGSSPQQTQAMLKSDMARMGKVIKDAGIKVE